MASAIARYTRWLHTGWPAGDVEPLPAVAPDGSTGVPGLYVVGDLTGIPLLKLAADTGARAVRTIAEDPSFRDAAPGESRRSRPHHRRRRRVGDVGRARGAQSAASTLS